MTTGVDGATTRSCQLASAESSATLDAEPAPRPMPRPRASRATTLTTTPIRMYLIGVVPMVILGEARKDLVPIVTERGRLSMRAIAKLERCCSQAPVLPFPGASGAVVEQTRLILVAHACARLTVRVRDRVRVGGRGWIVDRRFEVKGGRSG